MSQRLDALAVRKYQDGNGNEKTAYTNIGVAWPMRDRDGYTLKLHAFPAPSEGEYVVLLVPPKPKDEERSSNRSSREPAGSSRPASAGGFSRDMDDDIPFAPEWRV